MENFSQFLREADKRNLSQQHPVRQAIFAAQQASDAHVRTLLGKILREFEEVEARPLEIAIDFFANAFLNSHSSAEEVIEVIARGALITQRLAFIRWIVELHLFELLADFDRAVSRQKEIDSL